MEKSIRRDDPVISAYRIHGLAYTRGIPVKQILAELMGMLLGRVCTIETYVRVYNRVCTYLKPSIYTYTKF